MKRNYLLVVLFLLTVLFTSACGHGREYAAPDHLPDLHGHHIVVYSAMRDEVGHAALELFQERPAAIMITFTCRRRPCSSGSAAKKTTRRPTS